MMGTAGDDIGLPAAADRRRRVALAAEPAIRIGPVTVDPPSRRVSHRDGREAIVDPRSMKVLVALLRCPGAVFSRDDLFESCWEGRFVTDDAVDRAVLRLRRAIGPVVDSAIVVETVTKVGHRAVLPAPHDRTLADGLETRRTRPPSGRGSTAALAALALAAFLLAVLWAAWPRFDPVRPQSVGILPFAAAAAEDRPLALGLGDQVRSDLSSRSDLQIVIVDPRADGPADDGAAAALGRGLGLTYVIGGRLGRNGPDLAISAWLVETASGRRIWGESVAAPFAGIGGAQERLGARLASALGLQLTPSLRGRPPSGEVQALYLSARALMRGRRFGQVRAAAGLLRDAASRDPDFAPVHARLGLALLLGAPRGDAEAVAAARAEAVPHLRRALRLAPDLAEAHAAMGLAEGFSSPSGMAHFRRAAELDPNDPEIQMWAGHVHGAQLDFESQLAAYRRAHRLDPLWRVAALTLIEAAASLGRPEIAEPVAARFATNAGPGGREAKAALALAANDLSGAYEDLQALMNIPELRDEAHWSTIALLDEAGLSRLAERYAGSKGRWRLRRTGATVDAAEIIAAHGKDTEFSIQAELLPVAVKRLVASGRAGELASLYDTPGGLLRISRLRPPAAQSLIVDAATVALVLRQAGRSGEADRLLAAAARQAAAMARGPAPSHALASAAAIYAAMDRREAALALLERAAEAGWVYRGRESLAEIGEEPAFAALRGTPRFEALRSRFRGVLDRERRQILELIRRGGDPA